MWHKGADDTMLNPIFWKKVQGQNILGGNRLQNAKYLVSKCCLKWKPMVTKHHTIRLIIIEQDTSGETIGNNKWHSTQDLRTPQTQSYRLWWGAASPILNDTPCVCIYTSYNQKSYKECIRMDNFIWTQVSGRKQRLSGGNTSSNPNVTVLIPRPVIVINWMERVCQRHWCNHTPTLLFESKTHKSINS